MAYENGKVLCTDARHAAYPGFFSRGLYAAPLPGVRGMGSQRGQASLTGTPQETMTE